jgi:hypothetical protein
MSLDIAILGANGSPKQQVSIGVDDHFRLMQLVGTNGRLLARLANYYADAKFEKAVLEDLVQEATVVRVRCHEDKQLLSFLNGLVELAELAKREQQPLLAIAD